MNVINSSDVIIITVGYVSKIRSSSVKRDALSVWEGRFLLKVWNYPPGEKELNVLDDRIVQEIGTLIPITIKRSLRKSRQTLRRNLRELLIKSERVFGASSRKKWQY